MGASCNCIHFSAGAVIDQITSKSSFLLEVHLEEQKKRVLAMFILFIKNVGLDVKVASFLQFFTQYNKLKNSSFNNFLLGLTLKYM